MATSALLYNNSSNSTTEALFKKSTSTKNAAMVCLFVISVVGLTGNCIAVFIIYKSKSIRKCNCYILLVSQSIADMGTCLCSFVWIGTIRLVDTTDMAGASDWFICAIVQNQFLLSVTILISSYNLGLVSVERMFSIVYPVFHRLHLDHDNLVRIIAAMWVFGLVAMLCFAVPTNGIKQDGSCYFWSRFSSAKNARFYAVVFIGVYNAIPIVTMLLSYVVIYSNLHRTGVRANVKLNVIKMLASCIIAYLLCHGMKMFLSIAARFDSDRFKMDSPLFVITVVFMQMNSSVNPIIYMFQYKDYRRELIRQIYRLTGIIKPTTVSDSSTINSIDNLDS